ncbi:caspase, EACC1-associated type [Streptomyces lincolnensis]|uniref:caspase, EACC1-associated type n=1 Tax=Streptomyces lincolnensis TaxID=1915 RepID=UPI0037D01142
MPGSRKALLIATGDYEDPALKELRSPARDAAGLAEVLRDPHVGAFDVTQVIDRPQYEVNRALEHFFLDRSRDDLLLLHFSCHGIKDDGGRLYFAARDTDRRLLASTAISAAFVHDQMRRCRAKSIVVLLDCCYSGAFLPGAKGATAVHVREELAGHGRAVLTATNRTEYAWEGDHLTTLVPEPSRFTGAVIDGLRTGEADRDRDGIISVHELYDHVYERILAAGVRQRPQIWAELEYRVAIARAAGTVRKPTAERPSPGDAEGAWRDVAGAYVLPSLGLLARGGLSNDTAAAALTNVFADCKVDATVIGVTHGPTERRYDIGLGSGVQVERIIALMENIRYAVASPDARIVFIPGSTAVGIGVPNSDGELVPLGDVLRAAGDNHCMVVGLGKDTAGGHVLAHLAQMPHLLIAGAIGSGKTSFIDCLITSILMRATPEDVRMMLVDSSHAELMTYKDIPHLIAPIAAEPNRAVAALRRVTDMMDLRYADLTAYGYWHIDDLNRAVRQGTVTGPGGERRQPQPYLLVIVHALDELMTAEPREAEDVIVRIAQLGHTVGIHLVLTTQRPTDSAVTELIKANVPSRLAFAASLADSRGVFDQLGTERLLRKGDGLFLPRGADRPTRVQGAFVTHEEVTAVVAHCAAQPVVTAGPPPAHPPEPLVFKGYTATVTLYADRAEIKRRLVGKVGGARDCVIPFADVVAVRCKEPTLLVNGYVQLATEQDGGRLRAVSGEAQKAITNNSRTVMFSWNQRATYASYLAAVTAVMQVRGVGSTR